MPVMPVLYPLKGKIQHYSWGGNRFIPELLGLKMEAEKPCAEYWLGAHPAQPSIITIGNQEMTLPDFINVNPGGTLSNKIAASYSGLPFLLKVLDVRQMLSIQVHPDQQAAVAAYEAENRVGIPLDAPHRNYKDANHKPELMVALSDFWLLHGFKPEDRLKEVLSAEPDLEFLVPVFENGGYQALYQMVMNLPQAEVNRILQPIIDRISPLYHNNELKKQEEDFWAARAAATFCKEGLVDRGIFSIYLFNLLHLKKGEGIFQPAGLPHAYLEGQNVEIMANSDNVLRAGLTDKHIDIAELMKHVRFAPTYPKILQRGNSQETVYESPAAEFVLTSVEADAGHSVHFNTTGPEILLVMEGAVRINAGLMELLVGRGQSVFLMAGASVRLQFQSRAMVFRAGVPD